MALTRQVGKPTAQHLKACPYSTGLERPDAGEPRCLSHAGTGCIRFVHLPLTPFHLRQNLRLGGHRAAVRQQPSTLVFLDQADDQQCPNSLRSRQTTIPCRQAARGGGKSRTDTRQDRRPVVGRPGDCHDSEQPTLRAVSQRRSMIVMRSSSPIPQGHFFLHQKFSSRHC